MKCGDCHAFSCQIEEHSDMYICLVDARLVTKETECRMPTTKEKKERCRKSPIPRMFEARRDIVRAALDACTGDMSEEEAMKVVKVLYGRDR